MDQSRGSLGICVELNIKKAGLYSWPLSEHGNPFNGTTSSLANSSGSSTSLD